MTSIQEQIKALQRRQATIEQYRLAILAIDDLPKHNEFEGLKEEVGKDLEALIAARIAVIENPASEKPASTASEAFTPEEVVALRAVVRRITSKGVDSTPPKAPEEVPETQTGNTPAPAAPTLSRLDRNDKLRFAMQNQHLANKRVIVHTKDGDVGGTVRGLDAPDVIVKTDTGYEAKVPIEQIELTT